MELRLDAPAKVNLTLDVLCKRTDGYHDLYSVMHTVGLYDTLFVSPGENTRLTCSSPLPENNTVIRAVRVYQSAVRCPGIHVRLIKRIPSEAGLGGASADAAATLRAMHRLYGGVSENALLRLAKEIGADVPFCLTGGCALAEGIGDRLTRLPVQKFSILIAQAARGISTSKLFGTLKLPVQHPQNEDAVNACLSQDIRALAPFVKNALEPAALNICPEIRGLKQTMLDYGALAAAMTGSGSAVFGLFQSLEEAAAARKRLGHVYFSYVCNATGPIGEDKSSRQH